jgi:DNA topoisomerase-1
MLAGQDFPDVIDYQFTARMEEDLDHVAEGQADWTKVMDAFYKPFALTVAKAQAEMPVSKTGPEPIGRACPDCGKDLVIRYGRYGKFIACSGFPECRHTEAFC